jgi:hypothetical protein
VRAGASAGMGGDDGGGDVAGRRPADGADGARGGRRRRVPVGRPHLGGHQAPRRQGQDLPVPRLRDRKTPAAAANRFAINQPRAIFPVSILTRAMQSVQGSSKAALLGEATVNLVEYADAFKPSAVTLPLKGSPGALLHVSISASLLLLRRPP